ncbi:MAG TPA: ATP-binding protein [Chryseolinea sp.]|nr:ATP-binding protein [Chryseolinea sp.]
MNSVHKILIVEHDSDDLELMEYELKQGDIRHVSKVVQNEKDYVDALRDFVPDVILCDFSLPYFDGPAAFALRERFASSTPFIFVSGNIGEENAIEFIKNGVTDYAQKDKLFTLTTKVTRAIKESKERTAKKLVEQQREFDRNNLKALLNNTHDMMWSVDADLKYITSNHSFDEMVKKRSGLTVTKGSAIIETGFSKKEIQRYKKNCARAFDGETFTATEHSVLPNESWSEISYYPIYKENNVVGTACFSRDITNQKKAESHLRLLESVITNTTDAVVIMEAKPSEETGPKIIYVNNAFTLMTGYNAEEIIGKTLHAFYGEKTDRDQIDSIDKAMRTFQTIEVEIVNYKKTGQPFWNNFTIVPVIDKTSKLTHCISIQRDVTARKSHEENTRLNLELLVAERTHDLHQALLKEKDLVEMKNKFVTIASHEFRTPLSTISFAAESIKNYFHQLSPDEIQRKLIKIADQATHMNNLLEDILTLGKAEAGKIKLKRISVDLKEFIDSLIEECRVTVKESRKIDFIYTCATGKMMIDDKLMRNIFINLLTNALKFSKSDTTVTIEISDLNDTLLIQVTDEGIGIEKSELSSIFESFQRGSNVSVVQGTGLGLSILKKAVEIMNGTIEVKSTINCGSSFLVMIPLQ